MTTRGLLAILALTTASCSYGLHQTARTTPPGTVSPNVAASWTNSELSREMGAPAWARLGAQAGVRVGLHRHVDVGLATFWGAGGQVDVKVAPWKPESRCALSPRLGGGYGNYAGDSAVLGLYGVIGSCSLGPLSPYVGLTHATHWIHYDVDAEPLPPGQKYADRTGTGDGLLQTTLGVQLELSRYTAWTVEYGLWTPAQNDPGDGFRFATTHVLSTGLRFGRRMP